MDDSKPSIETTVLAHENMFYAKNMDLFDPAINDFKRWLESLPDFLADHYQALGFEHSIEIRDFMRFYLEEIIGVSVRDYLVAMPLTKEELEYWDEMERERIDILENLKDM